MQMKKATKVILGTAIVVTTLGLVKVFAGVSGFGFAHHGYGEHFADRMGDRIASRIDSELDLDDHQKTRLDTLIEQIKTIRKDVHQDRNSHKAQVLQLLKEPILDQNKAMAMLSDKTQTIESIAPQVISAIASFTDSLNVQQREKIVSRIEEHSMHRH